MDSLRTWATRLLLFAATVLCVILAWQTAGEADLPGCGEASGCDEVLGSRWSRWLGIPVSYGAIGVYAAALAAHCCLFAQSEVMQRFARFAFLTLITIAAISAFWFLAVQALVLERFCPYCTLVHSLGIAAAAIAVWDAFHWLADLRRPAVGADFVVASIGGAAIAGTLVAGQLLFPPELDTVSADALPPAETADKTEPPSAAPPSGGLIVGEFKLSEAVADNSPTAGAERPPSLDQSSDQSSNDPAKKDSPEISVDGIKFDSPVMRRAFLGDRIVLDMKRVPHIWNRDAKHHLVVLADYSCPHCRTLHRMLANVKDRYGEQLGLVVLPVPLNSKCFRQLSISHPRHRHACDYARLAMAVWLAKPDSFAEFDDWLFRPTIPPPPEQARQEAERIVGAAALKSTLESPQVDQLVQTGVRAFIRCGRGKMPKLIVEDHLVNGEPSTRVQLFRLIEREFRVTPASP